MWADRRKCSRLEHYESIRRCWKQIPRWFVEKNERMKVNTIGRSKLARWLTSFGVIIGLVSAVSTVSGATSQTSIAYFQGGTIDLAQGWGSAQICDVTSTGTYCFADQSEYQTWADSVALLSGVTPLANCSSGLDLYENIDYGGSELIVSSRSNWINLSTYGFSDVVSSFKVGVCSISMTDGTNGSGSVYPGPTSPSSDVSWIGAAWNDRVKSVYIY
jgi:hypothetical protein